jgi:hypothetical protein
LARLARSVKYFSVRSADSFSATATLNELVERHALRFGRLACLIEK